MRVIPLRGNRGESAPAEVDDVSLRRERELGYCQAGSFGRDDKLEGRVASIGERSDPRPGDGCRI